MCNHMEDTGMEQDGITLPFSDKRKVFNAEQWSRLFLENCVEPESNDGGPAYAGDVHENSLMALSRLLSLHATATNAMRRIRNIFFDLSTYRRPYIVGISGSVAVGKSSFARRLKTALASDAGHPTVQLITTDSFIFPLSELKRKGLLHKKGFPESYDNAAILEFLHSICTEGKPTSIPVYSHKHYDVVPGESLSVSCTGIVILEGLNIFQTNKNTATHILDFVDFSIYMDAPQEAIKNWYLERFIRLKNTGLQEGDSHFAKLKELSDAEALTVASDLWDEINLVNLVENILPSRMAADLIIEKATDHTFKLFKLRTL